MTAIKTARRHFHEFLLALCVSTAITIPMICGILAVDAGSVLGLRYYFLRSSIRIASLLHLGTETSTGQELTFLVSSFALAILVWALFQAMSHSKIWEFRVRFVALAVLCGPPAVLAWISMTASIPLPLSGGRTGWSSHSLLEILGSELAALVTLWLLKSRRPVSLGLSALVLISHCAVWTPILWSVIPSQRLTSPKVFLAVFPASAFSLLGLQKSGAFLQTLQASSAALRNTVFAILSIALLGLFWFPPQGSSGLPPTGPDSVVKVKWYPCFGMCPSFEVSTNGAGAGKYRGIRNVRLTGDHPLRFTPSQVSAVWEELRQIHFDSLDDRAFEWCYDTPRIEVLIAARGQTRAVVSDTVCSGAPTGPQARFVQAAVNITRVLGVDPEGQNSLSGPAYAKDVLELFCRLDANGIQLQAEGRDQIASLFAQSSDLPSGTAIVIKGFALSKPVITNQGTHYEVEYTYLGQISLQSGAYSQFAPDDRPEMKVRRGFDLIHPNRSRSGTNLPQPEWLIQGFPPQPHITIETAIRYVAALRDKAVDERSKETAEKGLSALMGLQVSMSITGAETTNPLLAPVP